MEYSFDIGTIIKVILKKILYIKISLVLYINSKFLYNYLLKFVITHIKHLIIYVISLCPSYKRCKITKMK